MIFQNVLNGLYKVDSDSCAMLVMLYLKPEQSFRLSDPNFHSIALLVLFKKLFTIYYLECYSVFLYSELLFSCGLGKF